MTFKLDLDLEHILDGNAPGDHCVKVWRGMGHFPGSSNVSRQTGRQTDGRTDRRTLGNRRLGMS